MGQIYRKNSQSEGGCDRDGAVMQLDDAFTDGEAEAVASCGVRRVRLVELVEDTVLVFVGDRFSGVPDLDREPVVFRTDFDDDLSADGTELDGVVEEIDPDFGQHVLIAGEVKLFEIDVDLLTLVRPLLFQHEHTVAQLLGQVEPGDYVLLTAFGGGLTWGAILIRW